MSSFTRPLSEVQLGWLAPGRLPGCLRSVSALSSVLCPQDPRGVVGDNLFALQTTWSRRVPNANCCSTQRGHPRKLQQRQQRAGFGSLMQSVTLSLHKCPRFVVWPTRPTFWCSDMPGEQPGAFCDLSRRHDFHVKTQESCREAGERSHCPVLGPDDHSLHFYDLRGFEVPSG